MRTRAPVWCAINLNKIITFNREKHFVQRYYCTPKNVYTFLLFFQPFKKNKYYYYPHDFIHTYKTLSKYYKN